MEGGPDLPDAIDMRGNIIRNGAFRKLTGWDAVHKSNVEDVHSIIPGKNHVVFERKNSGNDGGTVGIVQILDANVVSHRNLFLNIDVRIDHHSLKDTGYLARTHGGIGELPLMISIKYRDINDALQLWNIGFITRDHTIKDIGSQQNIILVRQGQWSRHEFDLMKEGHRRDSAGNVIPKPKQILKISIQARGWDLRSAAGNLRLSSRAAHVLQSPKAGSKPPPSSRNTGFPSSTDHPGQGERTGDGEEKDRSRTGDVTEGAGAPGGGRGRADTSRNGRQPKDSGASVGGRGKASTSRKDRQPKDAVAPGEGRGKADTSRKDRQPKDSGASVGGRGKITPQRKGRTTKSKTGKGHKKDGSTRALDPSSSSSPFPSPSPSPSPSPFPSPFPSPSPSASPSPSKVSHPVPPVQSAPAPGSAYAPLGTLTGSFKYDRVYVDGSNVAHGVDLKRPIVANILLIYNKLREIGFPTIVIIADASLRHRIDDKRAFEDLIDSGIVSQSPAKTSADEFLIGFAKQKTGYIVTNDKLLEWRKKDEWAKKYLDELSIQFMIQEDMVIFVGFPG